MADGLRLKADRRGDSRIAFFSMRRRVARFACFQNFSQVSRKCKHSPRLSFVLFSLTASPAPEKIKHPPPHTMPCADGDGANCFVSLRGLKPSKYIPVRVGLSPLAFLACRPSASGRGKRCLPFVNFRHPDDRKLKAIYARI